MTFERFMKKNKLVKENTTYAATKSLVDENGEPLKWVIRPVTTKQNELMRDECTKEIPMGKPGAFRPKLDLSKYMAKLLVASVEMPNLYDKDLQNSYDVMTPEDLVQAMVDDPGEYQDFVTFVQTYQGFTEMDEEVEEAKN